MPKAQLRKVAAALKGQPPARPAPVTAAPFAVPSANPALRDPIVNQMYRSTMSPKSAVPTLSQASTAIGVAGVGVAVSQGWRAARDRGETGGSAALSAAKSAAIPAAIVSAPAIAKVAGNAATVAFEISKAAAEGVGVFDYVFLNMAHAKVASVAFAAGGAMKGVEIAARGVSAAALPGLALWGAYQGAREDRNMTRGAARGAVRSLDPSAIVTSFMKDKRGLVERGFDRVFGRPDAPEQVLAPARDRHAGVIEHPAYKDTWLDNRGRIYWRQDMSVRKHA